MMTADKTWPEAKPITRVHRNSGVHATDLITLVKSDYIEMRIANW